MKVFIGWSGERSRAVAQALHVWIPNVIQAVNPWMSEQDASKGASWIPELLAELSQASFGIICVTPENREAPWLAFEAGALKVRERPVCPFLLGLEPTDLQGPGPLTLFQSVKAEREDTLHMMRDLNQAIGDRCLPSDLLRKQFERCWPELDRRLANARSLVDSPVQERKERELLEEILALVRAEARESQVFAKARSDFASLFSRLLSTDPNFNPELAQAFQKSLMPLTEQPENAPPFSRMHIVEGRIVMAWVRVLGQGKYRATFSELQRGPDGDVYIDCDSLESAQETADLLVQEIGPHHCEQGQCGNWGAWQTYRRKRRHPVK